jgi:hypothetical protein
MIILDEPYSNALLRQAVKDKYAVHYQARISPYKDPYLRPILNRGLSRPLREEVLWYLLLFNPVYLPPLFDNLRVDKLISEELVQGAHGSLLSDRLDASRRLKEHPETVYEIEDLLVGELKASGYPDAGEPDLRRYVEWQRSGKLGNLYERRTSDLEGHAVRWFTMLDLAARLDMPLKASPRGLSRSRSSKIKQLESAPADAYCAVKIWLKEIEVQPRLDGIEDVLRLREEKPFSDFKDVVLRWAELISKGERSEEQEIRKEIAKANAQMKRLAKWKNVSGWITYLCLPVDVALILSGVPIPTSPIGVATQVYIGKKTRAYRWLMFGRTVH